MLTSQLTGSWHEVTARNAQPTYQLVKSEVVLTLCGRLSDWSVMPSRVAGAIEFSALARQCLNRRIGSLDGLARQVEWWTNKRNERSLKVHWSFTVAGATDKPPGGPVKRWYEPLNPANKPVDSNH